MITIVVNTNNHTVTIINDMGQVLRGPGGYEEIMDTVDAVFTDPTNHEMYEHLPIIDAERG